MLFKSADGSIKSDSFGSFEIFKGYSYMKISQLLILMCVLLVGSVLHADTQSKWMSVWSAGGNESDAGTAIQTHKGARFITGYFSSTLKFGDTVLESSGKTDVFLRYYGGLGDKWAVRAGGPDEDMGYDLAIDKNGSACVTGYFKNTATFQSTNGITRTVTGTGQSTIFIAKYDKTGILRWLHTGDGYGRNQGKGVAVQSNNGACYVTGMASGNTTFSSSNGSKNVVSGPGTWHMFLVKYDTNGNFRWGQTNRASPNSVAYNVASGKSGVYVTGWLEGNTTFRSRNGHDVTVTGLSGPVQSYPNYPDDSFIAKYNFYGNVEWVNQIGGYKAITTDVAVSNNGRISITGFIGNIDGTPSQSKTVATSQPGGANIDLGSGVYTDPLNRDVVIATYDTQGILLDALRIGGSQDENGTGITYDCNDNYYVSGMFQNNLSVGDILLNGTQDYNLFILKYSDAGPVWGKHADGAAIDNFQAGFPRLTVTRWNRVLVIGGYHGYAVFDELTRTSRGQEDIFVSRLLQKTGKDSHNKEELSPQIHRDHLWYISDMRSKVWSNSSPSSLNTRDNGVFLVDFCENKRK
jgi:hypothetical protein